MKKYLFLSLLAIGCSRHHRVHQVLVHSSCSVTQNTSSATINCTDGTSAIINDGAQGETGPQGEPGIQGIAGLSGIPGSPGQNGSDGTAGTSCSVSSLQNGALISCGVSSAVILNGIDGVNALTGMIGIAEILNPCNSVGPHNEILLKLSNGLVLALYDGGPQLDRLSLLIPGVQYVTTDKHNSSCQFSIDVNGDLVE